MKKTVMAYVAAGFIAGVVYVVACGGGSNSIAEAIGNAIDVIYDNTNSGLKATNVGDAIDEVAASAIPLSSMIAGTWVGTQYFNGSSQSGVTITFGADGSFSCSGGIDEATSALGTTSAEYGLCRGTYTWELLKGRTVLLTVTNDPYVYGRYSVIQIDSVDSEKILLYFSLHNHKEHDFFYGTKQ